MNYGKVLVGNGYYWIYFIFSILFDEFYYGDSFGWKLFLNFFIVMKLVFEVFYTFSGKFYIKFFYFVFMY